MCLPLYFAVLGVNVGSPCLINSDCLVTNTECWNSICTCTPGYVLDPSTQTCMTGLYKYCIIVSKVESVVQFRPEMDQKSGNSMI